jgi:hypothetical protein
MPLPLHEIKHNHSDGLRKASYERDKYGARLGTCRNGYQWSSMEVDREFLIVLQSIIEQALQDPGLE